jgi:SAM-dependent methyltransferase
MTAPGRPRLEWTRRPGTGPPPGVLGDLPGRAVLELGCGSGHNLAALAARGAIAAGIDHDPAKVARARALYSHLPRLQVIEAGAAACLAALPPGSADVCLSVFGALSFTAGPAALLALAARVLRPGGLLAVTLRADDDHDTVVILARRPVAPHPGPGERS